MKRIGATKVAPERRAWVARRPRRRPFVKAVLTILLGPDLPFFLLVVAFLALLFVVVLL